VWSPRNTSAMSAFENSDSTSFLSASGTMLSTVCFEEIAKSYYLQSSFAIFYNVLSSLFEHDESVLGKHRYKFMVKAIKQIRSLHGMPIISNKS
jgi:hypothetical protein